MGREAGPVKRLNETARGPALWALLLVAVAAAVGVTGFNLENLTWGHAWEFLAGMFPPNWGVLDKVLWGMAETVGIAFLGTFFAFLLAFPISFITARNVSSPWLGRLMRSLMAVLRSVPEIIWALVFVLLTDFGNVPGVLALMAHNVGILTKLIGEVYEDAPIGTQEAMLATGSGRATAVWYGILPWAMPGVLSHTFFRFECNIRTATLLGIVNAGGIGTLLMHHRALYMYDAMLVDILGILALVILADAMGAAVRKQVS